MEFATKVRSIRRLVQTGVMLAVDPASGGTSMPGWALYVKGEYVDSGVIDIKHEKIQVRLRSLYESLGNAQRPDVLAIEQLRGGPRTHWYLTWAVGVIIAATNPSYLLEVPVSSWRAHAGKGHQKSDENDARAIGACVAALAGVSAA